VILRPVRDLVSAIIASLACVSDASADTPATHRFSLQESAYFLYGWDRNHDAENPIHNDQVRFRLAVRYRMGDWDEEIRRLRGDWDFHLYFTFTHDAFWNLRDESAPFYDNNFAPGSYIYMRLKSWPFATSYGVKHQSNGRAGALSRSWNRYYATLEFGDPRKNALFGTITAWRTWGIAPENADIKDYLGHGELMLNFAPGAIPTPTRFTNDRLGVLFRAGMAGNHFFPYFEATFTFRIFREEFFAPNFVLQYFDGAGQILREYNRTNTVWRFGLGMSL
jgi:phospholipase A1